MSTIIKTNYVAVQLADRSQPGIYSGREYSGDGDYLEHGEQQAATGGRHVDGFSYATCSAYSQHARGYKKVCG